MDAKQSISTAGRNESRPRKPSGIADWIAYLTATAAGAGLIPVAPGTFGAIEGVGLFLLFYWIAGSNTFTTTTIVLAWVAFNTIVFLVGVVASTRLCQILRQKDPSRAVIDEVSGQMIALTPVLFKFHWIAVIAGFVLFRLFDIWKPYPIRKLEALQGGLGVMADDVLAGVYAALLVWIGIVFL